MEHQELNEEEVLKKRKEALKKIFKRNDLWVWASLLVLIILGLYIRSLPMQDHGGHPGLWDVTTNTWTLGPDLDPWLFERYAEAIVKNGRLPEVDTMRNVPLGFRTKGETMLLPYMIAYFHKIISVVVGSEPVEFSAALFPVIMFGLTVISFFLFVREIFKKRKDDYYGDVIAIFSTLFMIVIPVFLPRTVAGIPEKESAAFFFMFLSFYFFVKAWKNKEKGIFWGVLSGISTVLMGAIWGGYNYIFVTIALASFVGFLLNKFEKREISIYSSWYLVSVGILPLISRVKLINLITSVSTGIAFGMFLVLWIHFLIWRTSLKKYKIFSKWNIPENVVSLIVTGILGVVLATVVLGPNFVIEKIKTFHRIMFRPVIGRWNITVAENRQPFFTEWAGSFGPIFRKIPLMFWMFFVGSVVMFKNMLKSLHKNDTVKLTVAYVIFLSGLIFSRYSGNSVFNGENFISKSLYYLSAIVFIGTLLWVYYGYYKRNDKRIERVKFEGILLFSLFVIGVFSARSAVRLIMVLGPIAPIFAVYLGVEAYKWVKKSKTENDKYFRIILTLILIIALLFSFFKFYGSIKNQSFNYVPSVYNQQWQKAMQWVRNDTPKDAVFGHWWDYGYWVQSIGERATVLDGGNAQTFWNYWMGRNVLTGDNEKDALDFLYSHNATYFLIDSTDIGKYGAFSSIGSDKNYDRYSWFGTFLRDDRQMQETKNSTLIVYVGGIALDEDLVINKSGKEILLPSKKTGVGALVVPFVKAGNRSFVDQPYAILVYQGSQYKVNLRYVAFADGRFIEFKDGVEGGIFIMPRIQNTAQGAKIDNIGAALFLSPRLMRGMLVQKYLLDDPFDNFPHFKIAHVESNFIVENLRSQGQEMPEFIYFNGVQGPIKIWEIEYPEDVEFKQKYVDTDSSKYLDWKL